MGKTPDIFASLDISFTLLSVIALVVVLVLYSIFSLILVYHWRQYAIGARVIRLTLSSYFISTGALFLLAALTLFFI